MCVNIIMRIIRCASMNNGDKCSKILRFFWRSVLDKKRSASQIMEINAP